MDVNQALPLLAGLTPAQFMRRHWQKKPLLMRQAIPGLKALLTRGELFDLAARDEVESRLITQGKVGWQMKKGPFAQGSQPGAGKQAWTLLVQGVDLHSQKAHELLQKFRFVPDARLDDLMISLASTGGGVGPHFDSYDVFLLQASGSRRWQISKQKDLTLQRGAPLKILQNFEPDEEYVLEAGDMLYLPPRYAHDGVAVATGGAAGKGADCMTYSIGFRAPTRSELAGELLHRLAEFSEDAAEDAADATLENRKTSGYAKTAQARSRYRDPGQGATDAPAQLPAALLDFATQAIAQALKDPLAVACALGEHMTALKPQVWFDEPDHEFDPHGAGVHLNARTRMLYDEHHVFVNGESYRAKGADARLMQRLADQRALSPRELVRASAGALDLLADWHADGWLRTTVAAIP